MSSHIHFSHLESYSLLAWPWLILFMQGCVLVPVDMCVHEEARGQRGASSLATLLIPSLHWLLFLCFLIHQNVLIFKEILYSLISMHLDPLATPYLPLLTCERLRWIWPTLPVSFSNHSPSIGSCSLYFVVTTFLRAISDLWYQSLQEFSQVQFPSTLFYHLILLASLSSIKPLWLIVSIATYTILSLFLFPLGFIFSSFT